MRGRELRRAGAAGPAPAPGGWASAGARAASLQRRQEGAGQAGSGGCEWVRGELDAACRSAAAGTWGGVRGAGDPVRPAAVGFAGAPAEEPLGSGVEGDGSGSP